MSSKKKHRKKRAAHRRKKPSAPFASKDFLSMRETEPHDLDVLFKLAERMKRDPGPM